MNHPLFLHGLYGSVLLTALLCSIACTRWSLALSVRYGAFETPGPRKIHNIQIPNLGWIGILLGAFLPLLVVGIIDFYAKFMVKVGNPYVDGMLKKMPVMAGIALGGFLSILVGWLDDRKKLLPAWKIVSQILLALLLCALGVRLTLFASLGVGVLATIVWVLCVMNAFNILDNLDGSCAGVAMIACGLFLFVAAWLGQYFICLLLVVFLGALGGFLVFNFPPAKLFMGNAGSFFVGYMISALTILETFYTKRAPTHLAVVMPILLLAVPMYDTTSVILIRLKRKVPISRGDTNHFSHRLLRSGLSARQAVLVIYGITLLAGIGALFLPFVGARAATMILMACVGLLVCLGLWEWRTHVRRPLLEAEGCGKPISE